MRVHEEEPNLHAEDFQSMYSGRSGENRFLSSRIPLKMLCCSSSMILVNLHTAQVNEKRAHCSKFKTFKFWTLGRLFGLSGFSSHLKKTENKNENVFI